MEKLKSLLTKDRVLLIFSGIFSALPYVFPCLFFIQYFSFVPLFCVIMRFSAEKKAVRKGFLYGLLFFIPYFLITYSFFISLYPITRIDMSSSLGFAVAMIGWLVSSMGHGVMFSLIFVFTFAVKKYVSDKKGFVILSFIFAFIGIEKLTEYSPLAFCWARIAIGQYKAPFLLQTASLFGSLFVDAVILLINSLFALFLISNGKKKTAFLISALAVFAFDAVFGIVRINSFSPSLQNKKITVGIAQGNVGASEDFGGVSESEYAAKKYKSLVKALAESGAEIVVLPETAVPMQIEYLEDYYKSLSEKNGVPVFAGVFSKGDSGATKNSAVLVNKDSLSGIYSKRRLAPFGEFMPMRGFFETVFPFLSDLNEFSDDMEKGTDSAIIKSEYGSVGTLICYDSIFPNEARQSVKDGADVIYIVTNDVWYKKSAEAHEHLAHAVLRSIENARYAVRSANTGISAIIDSRGKIVCETEVFEEDTLIGEYYLSNEKTLYTAAGDIIVPILFAAEVVFCAILFAERRKNGQKRS